ncbi:MAG: hypothetical protein ABFD84_17110 [Candidatus Polarisedimenticolia bacterium]
MRTFHMLVVYGPVLIGRSAKYIMDKKTQPTNGLPPEVVRLQTTVVAKPRFDDRLVVVFDGLWMEDGL